MKKNRSKQSLILGFVLFIVSAFPAHAEDLNSKQISLESAPAQMKEFEFLIGNWTAISKRFSPDGSLTGEYNGKWEVQLLDDGRMIFDAVTWFNPDGTKESYFPTLRTFSPKTNKWEMTYMSSLNYMHSQSFRGEFIDGEGHFNALVSITPEQSVLAKIRFFDIKKDSFLWSMKLSGDDGKNWFVAETITAKRIP